MRFCRLWNKQISSGQKAAPIQLFEGKRLAILSRYQGLL